MTDTVTVTDDGGVEWTTEYVVTTTTRTIETVSGSKHIILDKVLTSIPVLPSH